MLKTTVLLVDDHEALRRFVGTLLERETDIEVVGEAGDGRSALALARELEPQVVIMDVGLPDICGIEVTSALIAADPELKVIALSTHSDKRYVAAMLAAGAVAYVVKNATGGLVRAVREAVGSLSVPGP